MANKATIRQTRYDLTHCRTYGLKLNLETDSDVIAKLATVDSMQGYIKQLIREDIARTRFIPKTENKSMEDKKMTVRELAQNWIENADVSPVPEIDIETAKQYISWMDHDTELPEDLTPENFMNAWNDIVHG